MHLGSTMGETPIPPLKAGPSFTPRALVLDMDGLMVDSEPLWFQVERAFAADRGGAWSHDLSLRCVGRGTPFTLRMMSDVFGFEVDIARDEEAITEAFVAGVDALALKPGCSELLAEAAGTLPLALASSSPTRLIEAVLRRFDVARLFQAVVSGDDVAARKPAPDIFLRAASMLGLSPGACAVLEDSIAGVTAARNAGMFVIAVPEGPPAGRGFEDVADVIVADLFAARAHLVFP